MCLVSPLAHLHIAVDVSGESESSYTSAAASDDDDNTNRLRSGSLLAASRRKACSAPATRAGAARLATLLRAPGIAGPSCPEARSA